jgi:hypothetical protein
VLTSSAQHKARARLLRPLRLAVSCELPVGVCTGHCYVCACAGDRRRIPRSMTWPQGWSSGALPTAVGLHCAVLHPTVCCCLVLCSAVVCCFAALHCCAVCLQLPVLGVQRVVMLWRTLVFRLCQLVTEGRWQQWIACRITCTCLNGMREEDQVASSVCCVFILCVFVKVRDQSCNTSVHLMYVVVLVHACAACSTSAYSCMCARKVHAAYTHTVRLTPCHIS